MSNPVVEEKIRVEIRQIAETAYNRGYKFGIIWGLLLGNIVSMILASVLLFGGIK